MSFVVCRTCAVEHASPLDVCAICADERQWVPPDGQWWAGLAELQSEGRRVRLVEREPGVFNLTSAPTVGIGQHSVVVRTAAGNLLWDPIGYLDDDAVAQVAALGPVRAIAASHPHMFGIQVEWSHRLGGVPVYVCEPNLPWVVRPDEVIQPWSRSIEPIPGVRLLQLGGHFPGSTIVHFTAADGAGVVLSSDTIYVNPDRASVAFMRSFPNHIPLSPAVVERLAAAIDSLDVERLYGNFGSVIAADARGVVRRSAERHIAWVRGGFDDET